MISKPTPVLSETPTLKRNLGLWAVVGLGLGYMTPTVVFDTFGMVARDTHNLVPTAYLLALVVMVFTAISYAKMSRVIPSAGSAFSYVRESIHPNVGFMVGWTSLVDYILLPMVNCLIIKSYLEALFPAVPGWVWVIVYCTFMTEIIYYSMQGAANFNMSLLMFSIVAMTLFVAMVVVQLHGGAGMGTLASLRPFFHDHATFGALLMGATIVCFSFIGFDAVTMYAEEARTPQVIPRAIILTVVIGGAIFLAVSYFTQLRFPSFSSFPQDAIENSTLPQIGFQVGGHYLQVILTSAGFCATLASGLASHASVSRMLLVMGRNNVLPKRFFGYVSPTTQTPTFNIVFVGLISLLAAFLTLEMIVAFINYGALIAFTFVNISVIAWFAIRQGRRHTPKDIFTFIILTSVGIALTGLLWANLHLKALIGGSLWALVGFTYLLVLTRGFRQKVADIE